MSSEKLFNEVVRIISKWSPKGEKILPNGARLICPTPHVAPEAWLHVLFTPLTTEKIEEMEKKLGMQLPNDFKNFLHKTNGLALFSYCIKIWGVRQTMARSGSAAWQPHDLIDHNYESERPNGSPKGIIYFGSTENGSSWCFFEFNKDGYHVGKTNRSNYHPDSYWPDFGSWLLSEMASLEKVFDANGISQESV
jgi:hypothetical protein